MNNPKIKFDQASVKCLIHQILMGMDYLHKKSICIHVGQKVFKAGDKSGAQKVWQRATLISMVTTDPHTHFIILK